MHVLFLLASRDLGNQGPLGDAVGESTRGDDEGCHGTTASRRRGTMTRVIVAINCHEDGQRYPGTYIS